MNTTTNVDFRDWASIEGCRRRYALYYSDPDCLRLHVQHPMSIQWDNHDIDGFGDADPTGAQPVRNTLSSIPPSRRARRSRDRSAGNSSHAPSNSVPPVDAHGSFAWDLVEDEALLGYDPLTGAGSAGVEFAPSSVGRGGADETLAGMAYRETHGGSPPFDDRAGFEPFLLAAQPAAVAVEEGLMVANPTMRYVEWRSHGYGIAHLTADEAMLEHWWQPILEPSTEDVLGAQHLVKSGSNHITRVPVPRATAGGRVSDPAPDPFDPVPPPVVPDIRVPSVMAVSGMAALAGAMWVARRRAGRPVAIGEAALPPSGLVGPV